MNIHLKALNVQILYWALSKVKKNIGNVLQCLIQKVIT